MVAVGLPHQMYFVGSCTRSCTYYEKENPDMIAVAKLDLVLHFFL